MSAKTFILTFFSSAANMLKTATDLLCEYAGTGRQARLRGVCLWRMGSSPITRTSFLILLKPCEIYKATAYMGQGSDELF